MAESYLALGFVIGLALGVLAARRVPIPCGVRGRATGTGRIIPPQGGSGTAKYRSFVDDDGRTCLLPNGWSSDFTPPAGG